jgi:hypothetical protein
MQPHDTTRDNPIQLCECGCGQPAPIAHYTNKPMGYFKGQPIRFIHGHNARKPDLVSPNPSGLCMCGCGEKTPIAKDTDTRHGQVAGHPNRFVNSAHGRRRPAITRFWEKVDKRGPDECWKWQAVIDKNGYGGFRLHGHFVKAHRAAYELFCGQIPDGMCVCHSCDNRACVNPAHLWLGTLADNNHDRDQKGRDRNLRGEEHHSSRFSEQEIEDIRALYATGQFTYRQLARRYGVSKSSIGCIIRHQTWRHI